MVSDKDSVHNTAFSDGWKNGKIRDNKGVFAAVFNKFSKTFDCIPRFWVR